MTDAQIISAVLEGDTRRFELLVERYVCMVRGLCATYVRGNSAQEDLVQETFIDGYVKLRQLRRRERFGPWLARIARNKCMSWLRKEACKHRAHNKIAVIEEASSEGVLAALGREEVRACVHQAIEGLPKEHARR